jgi:hypothetical protein
MTNYNGFEDNFDYLPDALNPHDVEDESTPLEDDRTKKMGSPRRVPLECYSCGKKGSYEKFGIPTQCPSCGSDSVHLDLEKDNFESEMVHRGIEDPFDFENEDWEKKFRESRKKMAGQSDSNGKAWSDYTDEDKRRYNWGRDTLWYSKPPNAVVQDESDQINRGQMGIMDEDSHQGDIGSQVISAKWYSYYDNLNFYASSDDDNPDTDEDHDITDTDDIENDEDADYGGKNKRNPKNDATTATLVAMGGIGTIPEGFINHEDNVHYSDEESFSHGQSKRPSETGISGENSRKFDPFDTEWNS